MDDALGRGVVLPEHPPRLARPRRTHRPGLAGEDQLRRDGRRLCRSRRRWRAEAADAGRLGVSYRRRRCVLLEPVRRRNPDMSRKSDGKGADFVFLPLGGVGEIGMNLYLYGYGRDGAREWLIVDMGVTFGTDAEPGIDVILPDIRFIEEERHNIAGLLLTHAHEDHFGAVIDLWPLLAGVPLQVIPLGDRRTIGPFDVELISMSHSIPEPSAVVIRTPLGAALHTGDWKLDENPLTSAPTAAV